MPKVRQLLDELFQETEAEQADLVKRNQALRQALETAAAVIQAALRQDDEA